MAIDLAQEQILRCFFAVDLTANAKHTICKYIDNVRHILKNPAIKWSKPENYHITLKFLGATPSSHIPSLTQTATQAIITLKSFPLTLKPLRLFPTPHKPRALVLGISPAAPLIQIAHHLEPIILNEGLTLDTRPLLPHLTIARFNKSIAIELSQLTSFTLNINVDEIGLFHSELTNSGSIYHKLAHIKLL